SRGTGDMLLRSCAHPRDGSDWEFGGAHQVFVNSTGGFSAFGDGPNDERLTTTHVARREDARDGGHVFFVGRDIATLIEVEAQVVHQTGANGSGKAHREEHEINVEFEFGSGNGLELRRR